MENSIKMDDLRVPLFLETSICMYFFESWVVPLPGNNHQDLSDLGIYITHFSVQGSGTKPSITGKSGQPNDLKLPVKIPTVHGDPRLPGTLQCGPSPHAIGVEANAEDVF